MRLIYIQRNCYIYYLLFLEKGKSPVGFLASLCDDEAKIQEMRFIRIQRNL